MDNAVNKDVYDAHNKMLDERFALDQADIKRHTETLEGMTKLTTEIGSLVKQHDTTIKEHEDRLEHLEHKPNVWLDRIIQLILGGVISAIVAAVMTGKI